MPVPVARVNQRRYGAGALYWAPAGTVDATYTPAGTGSKFTIGTDDDAKVPGFTGFLPLGITTEGMTFTGSFTTENDESAEYYVPHKIMVTGQAESLAVTLKTVNLTNLRVAMNAGTSSVTGGTPSATQAVRIRKPDPGAEKRSQLMWISQDEDMVLVIYSALQTGDFTIAGRKGVEGINLPLTFTVEQPDISISPVSYDIWVIGASYAETTNA